MKVEKVSQIVVNNDSDVCLVGIICKFSFRTHKLIKQLIQFSVEIVGMRLKSKGPRLINTECVAFHHDNFKTQIYFHNQQ